MPSITLPTAQLVAALGWTRRKRRLPVASIEAFMGVATLRCGPLTASVPCSGEMLGPVSFPGAALIALAKIAPAEDTLEVSVDGGRVRFGSLSLQICLDQARVRC